MANRFERGPLGRARETVEAHAGSLLSRAAVASSLVREQTIGPANDDRHLSGMYPLTPMDWKVARTRLREIGSGTLAEHTGITPVRDVKFHRPQDLPDVGITSVPISELQMPGDEDSVPIVFWPYGDRLLVGRIPE